MKSEIERISRSREQARKSYNAMSHWYDLFTNSEKHFTNIGIQMLDVQPNESILEIGCGTGHALLEFTKKGGQVIAIDLSERMLQIARRKLQDINTGLCQADGLSIPFPNECFDRVFISFTLELFDTPEIPKVLSEIHRVLKDGGKLGIVALAKQDSSAVRIYEWFHRRLPTLVDCRPIYLQPFWVEIGFEIQETKVEVMWGLPVEIAKVRK